MREYASCLLLRETVKKQRIFDKARWEYTRHLMTEEDIHINGKRIAMTEREMIDVMKNELDYMMLMTHESRLMLMNDLSINYRLSGKDEMKCVQILGVMREILRVSNAAK